MQWENVACDLCGSDEINSNPSLHHDYALKVPGEFTVVQCQRCGLFYERPRPDLEHINYLYRTYYPKSESVQENEIKKKLLENKLFKHVYYKLQGNVEPIVTGYTRGKVLDVGCGFGKLLTVLKEAGCYVHGIEIDPVCVMECKKKGLDVVQNSFENSNIDSDIYDTVILSHVIEHFRSPSKSLIEIRRILKPGGRVILICPNYNSFFSKWFGDYWGGAHLPFHFYHFTMDSISQMINKCGLRKDFVKTINWEFDFSESVNVYLTYNKKAFWKKVLRILYSNNIPARILVCLILRFIDFLFPSKGDVMIIKASK